MFFGCYSTPDVTRHATVAAKVVSIEFRAQLLLIDSPLPTFFCFISYSVFVSDSSWANAIGFVDNIPANAAAIKTVAMASVLFMYLNDKCDYIWVDELDGRFIAVLIWSRILL